MADDRDLHLPSEPVDPMIKSIFPTFDVNVPLPADTEPVASSPSAPLPADED